MPWITDKLKLEFPLIFRSCKQVQQLNKSVWNVNSAISSTTLLDSAHAMTMTVYVWALTLFSFVDFGFLANGPFAFS